IGISAHPPMRNPSIAPTAPPLVSQSSMTSIQPTPTIVPNARVKYSRALSACLRVGEAAEFPEVAIDVVLSFSVVDAAAQRDSSLTAQILSIDMIGLVSAPVNA